MNYPAFRGLPAALIAVILLSGCAKDAPTEDAAPTTLKAAFSDHFMIGAAMNTAQYSGEDPAAASLVATQFNTITPENDMKWERIHPEPDLYDFTGPDAIVNWGEANDQFIVGHTLVWHSQTPSWVWEHEDGSPLTRGELLTRLEDHIATVVGRYRGRINGWDVVNEALNDDGTLRDTPWRTIIGDDYLEQAFRFAAAADPDAELYYNDYSLDNAPKRAGAVRLVQQLQAKGVRIDGIGSQGHNLMDWPSAAQQDSTLQAFGELGIKVMITELDVTVLPRDSRVWSADVSRREELRDELNPYPDGLPDSVATMLAERYAQQFEVFVRHSDVLSRVTFWGVSDADSWLNGWPIPGRTDFPLLFDRNREPKKAFDAVIATAR